MNAGVRGRFAAWGIIIDDIVFPDGRTVMGVLGGGGMYAAIGMRLWSRNTRLISAVGADFDRNSLSAFGLDGAGLFDTGLPTPRAWQLFEENGRRTQIFRVPEAVWQRQLVLAPDERAIPPDLTAAHVIGRGDEREEEFVMALRSAGVRLSGEPIIDSSMTAAERASILRCLARFEFFSPGPEEAYLLTGMPTIREQLRALAHYGPRVTATRMGARGSVVYDRDDDEFWLTPAAQANVVDVTGAGNAYCGGFLVGLVEGVSVRQAAAQASVSAAMVIEQVGPPRIDDLVMETARRRAKRHLELIRVLEPADELTGATVLG